MHKFENNIAVNPRVVTEQLKGKLILYRMLH